MATLVSGKKGSLSVATKKQKEADEKIWETNGFSEKIRSRVNEALKHCVANDREVVEVDE